MPEQLKGPLASIFPEREIVEPLWHWREIGAQIVAVRLVRIKGEDGDPLPGVDVSLRIGAETVIIYEFMDNGVPTPFVRKGVVVNDSLIFERERSHFQPFGSILYPMKTLSRQAEGTLEVDCTEVDINPTLDPKTFTGY